MVRWPMDDMRQRFHHLVDSRKSVDVQSRANCRREELLLSSLLCERSHGLNCVHEHDDVVPTGWLIIHRNVRFIPRRRAHQLALHDHVLSYLGAHRQVVSLRAQPPAEAARQPAEGGGVDGDMSAHHLHALEPPLELLLLEEGQHAVAAVDHSCILELHQRLVALSAPHRCLQHPLEYRCDVIPLPVKPEHGVEPAPQPL
mmetsp:Transcript_2157/g.4950  ORF Transcript_2157/g.4950 Transcript_2157/m.4950 type:complete len:200 (+) Transcript_2157:159-758(+)